MCRLRGEADTGQPFLTSFALRLLSAGVRRIVCSGHPATTGRHTSQGMKPALTAALAERKCRRFSDFILLALAQVAWQKIPVVGVPRYGEPANSSTGTPSASSNPTFSLAPKA